MGLLPGDKPAHHTITWFHHCL